MAVIPFFTVFLLCVFTVGSSVYETVRYSLFKTNLRYINKNYKISMTPPIVHDIEQQVKKANTDTGW